MRSEQIKNFFEALFFAPKFLHRIVILFLLPLSLLYGAMMYLRRVTAIKESFGVPIVSVGNLIAGGSGKTPFVMALASRYEGAVIISRGYGRKSKGFVQVSRDGQILANVEQSGDEAMLMALSLPECSVIVSENRKSAILEATRQGAKLIILDDGFNRVDIKKFEILLEPEVILNSLPFPAGPFREFAFTKGYADLVLRENRDFKRSVSYENLSPKMLLATAISHPQRLDLFLPQGVVYKRYLSDHAYFDEAELADLVQRYGADSLLVTQKDAVKMAQFKLPLSIMKLQLEIDESIFADIDLYLQKERI